MSALRSNYQAIPRDDGRNAVLTESGCKKPVSLDRVFLLMGLTAVFACASTLAISEWIRNEREQPNVGLLQASSSLWSKIKSESLVEGLGNGAVATDDGRCSELGDDILQKGGNAIDAAVAVTLCLGIVNPAGSGPGGGAFVLLHADAHPERESTGFVDAREHPYTNDNNGKVTEVIDCREVAPGAATLTMFDDAPPDASWTGGLASAVPGQLHCLSLMHSRHGKLPWKDVIAPVVPLAREGVVVTPYLGHAINLSSSRAKIFSHNGLRMLMTKNHDGETLLQEGDIFTNPALADTLEAIMKEGIDALYKGERAKAIEEEFRQVGGILTAEDFVSYRPTLRDPLITQPGEVRGFTMVGVPPPSSGGCVVIGAARLLAGFPEGWDALDTVSDHRLVEAMKHAYAIRMSLSDPAFFSNITAAVVKDMMEGDFMEQLRISIKEDDVLSMSAYGGDRWGMLVDEDVQAGKAEVTEEGHDNRRHLREATDKSHRHLKGFQYLEDHGTTHLSIIDGDGNAVTMTTTINTYFGSGIVSPSTGIIFNSQMDDFASPGVPNHYGVAPSESNYIVAGKKPLSSISPTLVFRPKPDQPVANYRDLGSQKLVMAFGASGGPKIPTAALQTFVNFFFAGLPLFDAVVRPRLHDQLLFHGHSTTLYDNDQIIDGPLIQVSNRSRAALSRRNHHIAAVPNTGCVQAVAVDYETGLLSAVSDPRKGGRPAGH